ncbi:(2Fe-2S)-binding protein [Ottowia testudinis]|uniref:(2Fe-2S)-binding protein n=1 Tax=Ottowia testudinis TaxID=2816950 RepID=A0A975CDA0_9BURK|nr:(2Fe-2S)-binding protein [Ottowia testudinis]QTD44333.1 (2Fe-2S)-binding protein [Ottowia testudinis]
MIVCICKRVTEQAIAHHAHMGKSFDDIQFDLQVAMQCGRCEDCARELVARCHGCARGGVCGATGAMLTEVTLDS